MLSLPWVDNFFNCNGMRGRYLEAGTQGEAIIMIHGLGGSAEQWIMNIEPLSSAGYRVFCIDMPGCGKSDPHPNDDYTLKSLAKFIDNFSREKNLEKFYLVGLSMGGAICLRYTIDFPEKVKKLILVGSAGLGARMAFVFRILTLPLLDAIPAIMTKSQFKRFVRSMVFDGSVISEEVIDFYYPLLKRKTNRKAFIKTLKTNCSFLGLRESIKKEVIANLNKIDIPTLIIWGKQDKHMPIQNAYDAIKRMKTAKLIIFDKCKHNPQFEKPEEFNREIIDFLKSDKN
ncbi:MAG: alpha/beta hydrolase [Chitinispirillaceae bacterium]|nr:alpha/beta hydrolase [Chitinispirillaceae bacterium]